MKTYSQFIKEAKVLWPGTPEYKKAFPDTEDSGGKRTPGKTRGNLHDIKTTETGVIATRRYGKDGESTEPVKPAAPVEKRGRGRPAGAYGTYNKSAKKRVAEAYEILESLEDEEEIDQFIADLDEETIMELSEMLDEKVHSKDEDEDEDEDEEIEGMMEGKFVKSAGGVRSDRYGNPLPEKPPKDVSVVSLKQLEKNKRENPGQSPFRTQDQKVKKYLGLKEQDMDEEIDLDEDKLNEALHSSYKEFKGERSHKDAMIHARSMHKALMSRGYSTRNINHLSSTEKDVDAEYKHPNKPTKTMVVRHLNMGHPTMQSSTTSLYSKTSSNKLGETVTQDVTEEEQLDELKKSTVKSYQSGREKEVTSMATRAMWDPNFKKTGPNKDEYPSLKKSRAVRDQNFMAAARRLSGKIPTSK